MNCHLAARNIVVNNLLPDLKDGVILANLIEILSGQQLRYTPSPKTPTQCIDNIGMVLIALQTLGVNSRGCSAEGKI